MLANLRSLSGPKSLLLLPPLQTFCPRLPLLDAEQKSPTGAKRSPVDPKRAFGPDRLTPNLRIDFRQQRVLGRGRG
jgi:hypothetical protein